MLMNFSTWKNVAVVLFLSLLLISCKDNGTESKGNFKFRITVRNNTGAPISNLRVSAINLISLPLFYSMEKRNEINEITKTNAATVFGFSLAAKCRVRFYVLNLNDEEIVRLLDDELKLPGMYNYVWSTGNLTSGVYKYRITVRDTPLSTKIFEAEKYAVLYAPDPKQCIIGWTSSDGVFETANTLLFPYLWNLPPLIRTSSNGPDTLGTFSYANSVALYLIDTLTAQQQSFQVQITNGENHFQLTWNPSSSSQALHSKEQNIVPQNRVNKIDSVIVISPPTTWKLEQNYPNPFN